MRHGPAEEWRENGSQRRGSEDTSPDHEGRRSSEARKRSRAGNRFSLVLPVVAFTVLVAMGAIAENAGYMMIGAALLILWVAARRTGKL